MPTFPKATDYPILHKFVSLEINDYKMGFYFAINSDKKWETFSGTKLEILGSF